MPLFKLPTELAQCILNDWIHDPKSMASLDSACGRVERGEFLGFVRHSQFVFKQSDIVKNCPGFFSWISSRDIYLDKLEVNWAEVDGVAATRVSLPAVTTLSFCYDHDQHEIVPLNWLEFFQCFPALTCVHFPEVMHVDVDNAVLGLCKTSVPLETISTDIECIYSYQLVQSIIDTFGKTIKHMHLPFAPVRGETLRGIGHSCPCLESVQFGVIDVTNVDVLAFCAGVGQTLKSFTLDHYPGSDYFEEVDQDYFARQVAMRLPHATLISMMALSSASWNALRLVLELRPHVFCAQFGRQLYFAQVDKITEVVSCEFNVQDEGQSANALMTFLTKFPKRISKLTLKCLGMSVQNIEPFVARHGAEVEDLSLDLSDEEVVPDAAAVVLINGCRCAKSLHVTNWSTLSSPMVDHLDRNNAVSSLTLHCSTRSMSLSDDIVMTALLGKYPQLSILKIASGYNLVTDISAANAVEMCPLLTEMDLEGTSVSPEGIVNIIARLVHRPFRQINLSSEHYDRMTNLLDEMGNVGEVWKTKMRYPYRCRKIGWSIF